MSMFETTAQHERKEISLSFHNSNTFNEEIGFVLKCRRSVVVRGLNILRRQPPFIVPRDRRVFVVRFVIWSRHVRTIYVQSNEQEDGRFVGTKPFASVFETRC